MNEKELVIGFDIRENYLSFEQLWNKPSLEYLLLKKNVDKSLSTYRKVWSSVLDIDYQSGFINEYSLWFSLDVMRDQYLSKQHSSQKPVWEIAITKLDAEQNQQLRKQSSSGFSPQPALCEPSDLDNQWLFLGYDVSDDFLWSMLYVDHGTEAFQMQKLWAKHLNRYHLFEALNSAVDFAQYANQADPGHAPFSAYGLYFIRECK